MKDSIVVHVHVFLLFHKIDSRGTVVHNTAHDRRSHLCNMRKDFSLEITTRKKYTIHIRSEAQPSTVNPRLSGPIGAQDRRLLVRVR